MLAPELRCVACPYIIKLTPTATYSQMGTSAKRAGMQANCGKVGRILRVLRDITPTVKISWPEAGRRCAGFAPGGGPGAQRYAPGLRRFHVPPGRVPYTCPSLTFPVDSLPSRQVLCVGQVWRPSIGQVRPGRRVYCRGRSCALPRFRPSWRRLARFLASASWPGNASIGADAPRFHGPEAPGRRPVGHDPQGIGPPGKRA